MKKIGERVILNTLMKEGDYPGEIIDIDPVFGLCLVKLDCQDTPVSSVLYFDEPPEVVNSSLWQICYPAAHLTQRAPDLPQVRCVPVVGNNAKKWQIKLSIVRGKLVTRPVSWHFARKESMNIKWLFRYLTGRAQFAPPWFYKLPYFMLPLYQGDNSFRWFGIRFAIDPDVDTWGKTLFMVWRSQLTKRAVDVGYGVARLTVPGGKSEGRKNTPPAPRN